MYQRFKDRFGAAGVVVAVIALVAALGGTALAASGALTGKQKKEVEKIAKKYAGKPGAAGAQGPAGPQGAAGANGKDGAQGAQGPKGDTGSQGAAGATGAQGPKGDTGSAGATGATGAAGAPGPPGPPGEPGEPGEPWTADGTLPSGATETGSYAVSAEADGALFEEISLTAISFNVPLAGPLAVGKAIVVKKETTDATCTGSAANPTAPNGVLCVYEAFTEGMASGEVYAAVGEAAGTAGRAGALITYEPSATKGIAVGTWAVTGS